jgi:antitoxin (DNA-binding transcriptional repressor) of toxin-antitoxin stability system
MKAITVQQLHEETEHWVHEVAGNGGLAITDHQRTVATLTAAAPLRREQWLRQRLTDLQAMPALTVDSGDVVAALREERA